MNNQTLIVAALQSNYTFSEIDKKFGKNSKGFYTDLAEVVLRNATSRIEEYVSYILYKKNIVPEEKYNILLYLKPNCLNEVLEVVNIDKSGNFSCVDLGLLEYYFRRQIMYYGLGHSYENFKMYIWTKFKRNHILETEIVKYYYSIIPEILSWFTCEFCYMDGVDKIEILEALNEVE